jgi:two-component system NarL family response regulator
LALIKTHLPDVALLDLRMPRMDGLDVVAEVNAMRLHTKVIVMTSFEDQEDIQHAVKAGARAYLLKDCSRQTLLEAIRRVHLGEVYLYPDRAETRGPDATTSVESKGIGGAELSRFGPEQ